MQKHSTANDLLLRPLCAKYLPETFPEQQGWVDREKLFAFTGRSRKPQIALANSYGFDEFAQPSGGCCVLTDENYSRKLNDMWQARAQKSYTLEDIILLKVGRHLRPRPHYKLIIGREEGENNFLEGYRKKYPHVRITTHDGPLTLIDGQPESNDWEMIARIVARFSAGRNSSEVGVKVINNGAAEQAFTVKPLPHEQILKEWYR